MRGLTVLIVCFLFSLLAIGEEKVVYNFTNWKFIKNEKLKFAMKLPDKWKFLEQKEPFIQVYYVADKDDQDDKDASAKKISIESKAIGDDLKKVGDDMIKVIKSGQGGKEFIREKAATLGSMPARVILYHAKEDGVEKTFDVTIIKYKSNYFAITFTTRSLTYEHDKALKDQILSTFNFDVMQPSAAYEFKKPKDWFDFKDNEYPAAYSKKDNVGASPGDGIIKVKTVRVDEEKTLQQFCTEFVSTATKDGAITKGFASTSPINGKPLMWFDVIDKDNLFKERYHIAKDGYSFYIIYFISNNELFEKELKMVLAESLLTFKVKAAK